MFGSSCHQGRSGILTATRIGLMVLIAGGLLSVATQSAFATAEGASITENSFNLSAGVINAGQAITASANFSLSNHTSSGGAGTTTRGMNTNTITYSGSGTANLSQNVTTGGSIGTTSQTFTTGSLSYFTPGVYTVSLNGTLTWTAQENASYGFGQGNPTASQGFSDSRTVTVLNVVPQSVTMTGTTVNEGTAASVSMTASSPGTDTLTFNATGASAGSTVATGQTTPGSTRSASVGVGTYVTPGTYTVTGSVQDNFGGSSGAPNALVTVLNVPPHITSVTQNGSGASVLTVNEGSTVGLQMQASDPGAENLTFTINGGSAGIGGNTPGSTRTSSTVNVTYNNVGLFTNTYQTSDGIAGADNNSQHLQVSVLNVPPTITSVTQNGSNSSVLTVNEGSTVALQMQATDPGAENLTFTINGGAAGIGGNVAGSTRTSSSVGVTYNNVGLFTNTFQTSDGIANAANGPQSLQVSVLNVPPHITSATLNGTPGDITVNVGQSVSMQEQATDPGAENITFTINGGAAGIGGNTAGSTRTSSTQSVTYLAPGIYTETFQASDGIASADNGPVIEHVTVLNVAPTITGLNLSSHTIMEGQSITANMTATSPSNQPITFTINGNPAGTDNTNIPNSTRTSNTIGLGPFYATGPTTTYNITGDAFDGTDHSTTSDVLTVLNVAPTVTSIMATYTPNPMGGTALISFTANAFDPGSISNGGSEVLVYNWDLGSGFFTDFTGQTTTNFPFTLGTHTVRVQVTDGIGGVGIGTYTFTVVPEPTTLAVMVVSGGALATAGWYRRRRKR